VSRGRTIHAPTAAEGVLPELHVAGGTATVISVDVPLGPEGPSIQLYEALTGHHPFDPKLPLKQLLTAILTVSPADPRRLNPEAPESLCALAMCLLAKEPSQRPPSVHAVRARLTHGAHHSSSNTKARHRPLQECSRPRSPRRVRGSRGRCAWPGFSGWDCSG